MQPRQALANRGTHGRRERGREARRRTVGRVDHVARKGQHVCCRQDFEHFAGARYHTAEQIHLSPHRADRSGIVRG